MSEKRIKVTDRRMFTPDGRLREEYRDLEAADSPAADSPPAEAPPAKPESESPPAAPSSAGVPGESGRAASAAPQAPPVAESPPGRAGPLPQPTFFDLVGLLAEPVALYLGDAQLPDGKSAQDLEMARLHIDLLDVLKTKTEGNLTPEESEILVDLIYRLRLRYVQKNR